MDHLPGWDATYMKILLTNDDGIFADGLWALYRAFKPDHHVSVVAPDRERSAIGHAITLHQPLRSRNISINGGLAGIAVNGTPADCVKLGLTELVKTVPDIVISGINPGENVGANLNYSGTVAAAKEAALFGLPAISLSVRGRKMTYRNEIAKFAVSLARIVLQKGLPFGTFLNVNTPDLPLGAVAGVRISRQGITRLAESYEMRVDPRNTPYYWSGPDSQAFDKHPDVDGVALEQDFISITPVTCDHTNYAILDDLKSWPIALSEDSSGGADH